MPRAVFISISCCRYGGVRSVIVVRAPCTRAFSAYGGVSVGSLGAGSTSRAKSCQFACHRFRRGVVIFAFRGIGSASHGHRGDPSCGNYLWTGRGF